MKKSEEKITTEEMRVAIKKSSKRKKVTAIFTTVGVAAVALSVGVGLALKDANTYYTVNWNSEFTQSTSEQYKKGSTVTLEAPTKDGYVFSHWEKNGEIVSTDEIYSFEISADTQGEYTAVYLQVTYTISWNTSLDSTLNSTDYGIGDQVTLEAPEITGYEFSSWKKGEDVVSNDATYIFDLTADNAGTYTAVYTAIPYTFSWTTSVEDDMQTWEQTYDYGTTVTMTAPEIEGYTFSCWKKGDTEVSTNSTYSFTASSETEGAYVAVYTINPYTFSWTTSVADDTQTWQQTYNYGTTVSMTAPEIEGYTFSCWKKGDTEVSTNSTYSFTASSETEGQYLAVYTLNSYTATWSTSVETDDSTGGGSYDYGTTITFIASEIEGYTFSCWKKGDTEVSTNSTYSFTASSETAGAYVAVYTINPYTFSWTTSVEDDTQTWEQTYDYGTTVTMTAPEIEGYTFSCWKKGDTEVSTNSTYSYTASSETEGAYVAVYTINPYTFSWTTSVTDDTQTWEQTYDYGTTVSMTAPEIEGYTFSCWKKGDTEVSTNSTYSYTASSETAGAYVAVYTVSTYTATWTTSVTTDDSTGGGSYDYGTTITFTAPSITGYVFSYWKKDATIVSGDNPYSFTASSATAGSYEAVYTEDQANKVALSLSVEDVDAGTTTILTYYMDEATATISAEYDSDTTLDETTTCGWYTDSACTLEADLTTVTSGTVLYTKLATLDKLTFTTSGTTASVKALDNSISGALVIPKLYETGGDEYTVTAVASSGFDGCSSITSINLPSTITDLGGYAFRNCTSLTSVNYYGDSTLATIGTYAFYKCMSLTSITIPESVTSIGTYAFDGCSSLTGVYITDIDAWAQITFGSKTTGGIGNQNANPLYYAYNLYLNNVLVTEVTLSGLVTEIGRYAFYNCTSITSITIPESVTSIGNYAFFECTSLTSITIPESVTSIGSAAFRRCRSLTSITIPANVTTIYTEAFYGCTSLTSITIPEGVTSIGTYAFYECTGLTSITIPESVTSIGNYAFYECTGLTSITIPESVTSIGNYAFRYCYKLVEVYNLSDLIIEVGSTDNGYVAYYALVVYNSAATETKVSIVGDYVFYADDDTSKYYLVAYTGSDAELTLPANIKGNDYAIDQYAFYGNTSLISITIPASVTSIGNYAFQYCYKLAEVYNLSSSFTISKGSMDNGYVGYYALNVYTPSSGSSKLTTDANGYIIYADDSTSTYYLIGYTGSDTELILPTSIKGNDYEIYQYAFSENTNITSVVIPEGVTGIGTYSFNNCTSLTSITIPESVTSIGDYAFYSCTSLTSVDLSNCISLTSIGNHVFHMCSSLMSIDLSNCTLLTSIGNYTFSGCTSLTSVTMPASVTSIGSNAFYNCTSLTSITIPESVTSIGSNAFYNCTSLTSITIPESVTSIGTYAFYNCTGLTTIYYNATLCANLSFGNYIFYRAGQSGEGITVHIGDNVTSLPAYLFYPDTESYSYFPYSPKITSVIFGSSSELQSIGNFAFYGCRSLTSITIPESVTSIGNSAFYNCSSLTTVYYGGTADEWSAISIGSSNTYLTDAIYYYSATEPADTGNYWYYDGDGNVAIWPTE